MVMVLQNVCKRREGASIIINLVQSASILYSTNSIQERLINQSQRKACGGLQKNKAALQQFKEAESKQR